MKTYKKYCSTIILIASMLTLTNAGAEELNTTKNDSIRVVAVDSIVVQESFLKRKMQKISRGFKFSKIKIPRVDPERKIDRGIRQEIVIPKGQWITGGNISYSEHTNDNYKFLVIKDWSGSGYNFSISPFVGYAFKDNVAAGMRFAYDRSLLRIDQLSLNLGDDLNFDFNDAYQLNHAYYVTGFIRTYINIGDSKRFALFNEARVTMGGGQGKIINGKGASLDGTYQTSYDLQIGMSPGLTAFISDFAAVEVSVGVLGFNFKWINQTNNQVETGYRRTSSGNFKINLFSIGLGLAFYL